jgi:hypothetical protein
VAVGAAAVAALAVVGPVAVVVVVDRLAFW